jgi:uncharacterized protein (TIGR02678 family)
MTGEQMSQALHLLFENFWIIREDAPEQYLFLRRHQGQLQKELRQRFGMNLIIRPQYIQLLKRPHRLAAWMGEIGFQETQDYALFCLAMAFVEDLEAETPFMLDELIRSLDLLAPEEVLLDWTNYNQRKSLVRVLKKLISLRLIETIQGETAYFEQSEANQEVLFVTTPQARSFLARAPQSYTQYPQFEDFWADLQANRGLEINQLLYQRLMMEPVLIRSEETEDAFSRLRNYARFMKDFLEENTEFSFELYRDYAAFTTERRDTVKEVFPSRQVIDDLLIQLATLLRQTSYVEDYNGMILLSDELWQQLVLELQSTYQEFWSKEFKEMNLSQLSQALLRRGMSWQLLEKMEDDIKVYPAFGRMVAEMRKEYE